MALGILKRIGYTNITTAEDGKEALKAVEAAGGPDAFHVILTDLHMPRMVSLSSYCLGRCLWAGMASPFECGEPEPPRS